MAIPDTPTGWGLTDVIVEVGGTSLTTAFAAADDAKFDVAYVGVKDRLTNFRNYGAIPPIPVNNLLLNAMGVWRFNEAAGAVNAVDSMGLFADAFMNGTEAGVPGLPGLGTTAFQFPVSGGVEAPSPGFRLDSLGNPSETPQYSMGMWIKSNLVDASSRLMEYRPNNSGNYPVSIQMGSTAPHDALFTVSPGSSTFVTVPGGLLFDDVWHHVLQVVDITGGLLYAYVDGVLYGTIAIANADSSRTGGNLTIGINDGGSVYKGTMQQVAIWERALTALDAEHLFNAGAGIPFPSWTL
jgi:hypothetical protein